MLQFLVVKPVHKMELFQVAVGREHGLNPSHLVGAIIITVVTAALL